MPSRVSLSVLAFICGMAVMFLLAYYQVVSVPELRPNITTAIIVLIGVAMVVVGWVRIFRRRPQRRPKETASGQ